MCNVCTVSFKSHPQHQHCPLEALRNHTGLWVWRSLPWQPPLQGSHSCASGWEKETGRHFGSGKRELTGERLWGFRATVAAAAVQFPGRFKGEEGALQWAGPGRCPLHVLHGEPRAGTLKIADYTFLTCKP